MTKNHETQTSHENFDKPIRGLGWAATETILTSNLEPAVNNPPVGFKYRGPLDEFRINEADSIVTVEEAKELQTESTLKPLQGELPEEDAAFKENIRKLVESTLLESPTVIYNPGCGEHVSVAMAFPEARTIFVDPDGYIEHRYIERQNNSQDSFAFEFYRADMHNFTLPDDLTADLVLLLNTEQNMTQNELDRVTRVGGIVAVNNWHGGATYVENECPNYHLKGCFDNTNNSTNELYAFRRVV